MDLRYLKPKTLLLIRLFLGGTFFAQGFRAITQQPDFYRLVGESPIFELPFLSGWFTPGIFLILVGIFDFTIAALLWAGVAPRKVAFHGFIWICIVMINSLIIGRIIETVDSMGYLGGLLAIMIWDKDKPSALG